MRDFKYPAIILLQGQELIGCHGGLGGYQTQAFLLFPSEWQVEEGERFGAAAAYRQLKSWLNQNDHQVGS